MYVLDSGLGDFPRGQCEPIPQVSKIIAGLEQRKDLSPRARVNDVTDGLFINRHPEFLNFNTFELKKLPSPKSATPAELDLIREWGHIRDCMVLPVERVRQKVLAEEKQQRRSR